MRQCFWKRELSFKLLGFIFLLFDLEVIRSIYQSNLYVWNVSASASALHYLLALLLIEKMVSQSRLLLQARKGCRPRIVSNSIKTEQSQIEFGTSIPSKVKGLKIFISNVSQNNFKTQELMK